MLRRMLYMFRRKIENYIWGTLRCVRWDIRKRTIVWGARYLCSTVARRERLAAAALPKTQARRWLPPARRLKKTQQRNSFRPRLWKNCSQSKLAALFQTTAKLFLLQLKRTSLVQTNNIQRTTQRNATQQQQDLSAQNVWSTFTFTQAIILLERHALSTKSNRRGLVVAKLI